MNCPNCNAANADGAKFCIGCGSPLPVEQPVEQVVEQPVYAAPAAPAAPEQPAEEKKAASKFDASVITATLLGIFKPIAAKVKPILSNKKVLIGIAAGAVALIALIIVCSILGSGNGYITAKQTIRFESTDDGEEITVVVDKKVLDDTIDGSVYGTSYSIDGKVAAVLTSENELWVVNGKKVNKISEDVTNFTLSVEGDGIAFVTADEDSNTLSLAKTSNGKVTEISDELASYNYVISPDGKSVVYFEEDNLMFFKGKESEKICKAEDTSVLGLSDNGKQIYVADYSGDETRLYSYNKKGDKEKLGTYSGDYAFNVDHSMIMFSNGKGHTYISKNGKEANKVSSKSLSLVIAPNAMCTSDTYPVKDLYDHVYTASDEVWLIKKNSDKNIKLVSNASSVTLDESGEYIYYLTTRLTGEQLRVIEISDGEKASEKAVTLVNDSIYDYVVTSNRKYVYYTDGDTLYSVNGKKGGDKKAIDHDLTSYSLALNGSDVVYYLVDEDLYACSNGKKGKKIQSDVEDIDAYASGMVYAESEDSLYATSGSKKVKKILDY